MWVSVRGGFGEGRAGRALVMEGGGLAGFGRGGGGLGFWEGEGGIGGMGWDGIVGSGYVVGGVRGCPVSGAGWGMGG